MEKQRQITLKFFRIPFSWEVAEIRNSPQLNPGDWINHDYVKVLCADPSWDVIIQAPDFTSLIPPVLPKIMAPPDH